MQFFYILLAECLFLKSVEAFNRFNVLLPLFITEWSKNLSVKREK